MIRKRAGTAGISGSLYETKLISLIYLRAIRDDTIVDFKLASNVDNVGYFDDICFKATLKGHDKPIALFIQTRHRENDKHIYNIDLATCFDSYLKIRHAFNPSNEDIFFKGTFEETDCFFVFYTNAKVDFSVDSAETGFSSTLDYLIDTGGVIQHPSKSKANLECLTKTVLEDQITSLAARIAEFIMHEEKFNMMLTDNLVHRYHVILAQKVFDVSDIQPDGHRIARFRHEFFNTDEDYLIIFKKTLFKEIVNRSRIQDEDVNKLLSEFEVMGTAVTNFGQLEFNKRYTKGRSDIKKVLVSRSTVNHAVELAAKEILFSREFKVPAIFGNKDLTIRGNDASKIERRIKHLTLKITDLLKMYESGKIVTIDDSLGEGLLQPNGGLAGAIGNIFVLDDNPKLMKITNDRESLGDLAKKLYDGLYNAVDNLLEYTFHFKGDRFPKLSFNCSDYEENLVIDFLNKLLLYCNQANHDVVEEIIKNEIEDYQRDQPNYFQTKTDVIFTRYHNKIQKWWLSPHARYLTRKSDFFQSGLKHIIKDPLLSIIKIMYLDKVLQFGFTFTEDAVRSLNMLDQHSSTVIISENSILTVVKVMQYLINKDYAILDLEYIANLPMNDRNALHIELRDANTSKVLILVCDKTQNSRNEKKTLEYIAEVVGDKTAIIITNRTAIEILQYFPKVDSTIFDKKLSLIDMTEESQKRILDIATVEFGGVEMSLDLLLQDWLTQGAEEIESLCESTSRLHVDQQSLAKDS